MLLADLPAADAGALGVWLLGLLTVLLIGERILAGVVSWRKLRQPVPATEATVTRAELDAVRAAMGGFATEADCTKLETALGKLEAALTTAIQRLDDYTHKQTHDLRDLLNPIANRLTVVEERTKGLETQFARVLEKLDRTSDRMAELLARVRVDGPTQPKEKE